MEHYLLRITAGGIDFPVPLCLCGSVAYICTQGHRGTVNITTVGAVIQNAGSI